MSPFTIHSNTSLPKDVLKSIAEPPDLACAHLFESGAGCECGTPNLFWGIEGYVYLKTFLFKDLLSQSCGLGVYLSRSIKSAPKRGPDESADLWVHDLECCTWSAVVHQVLGPECRYMECHVFKCCYCECWVPGVPPLGCCPLCKNLKTSPFATLHY